MLVADLPQGREHQWDAMIARQVSEHSIEPDLSIINSVWGRCWTLNISHCCGRPCPSCADFNQENGLDSSSESGQRRSLSCGDGHDTPWEPRISSRRNATTSNLCRNRLKNTSHVFHRPCHATKLPFLLQILFWGQRVMMISMR